MNAAEILKWVLANGPAVAGGIVLLGGALVVFAKLTPTTKDDEIAEDVVKAGTFLQRLLGRSPAAPAPKDEEPKS